MLRSAGIGQPEPARAGHRVQLVAVQLDRRRGLPAVRLLRRRRASVAGRADRRLRRGRAVGSIPLMPGGLLVVEAVLVPGLVSSGMTLASAISAMLIYRLVSWIFIAAIGWVVFFFMFRTEKDVDPDAGAQRRGAGDRGAAAVQSRPRSAGTNQSHRSGACSTGSAPSPRFSAPSHSSRPARRSTEQDAGDRQPRHRRARVATPVLASRGRRAHPGAGHRRQGPPGLRTPADQRPEPGRDR